MTLNPASRYFLARAPLYFGIPYLALHALPLAPLLEFLAAAETAFLRALGFPLLHQNTLIAAPNALFNIVPECTGLVMAFLLAALLYATKIPGSRRRAYLFRFTPLLLAYNFLRVALVIATGTAYGQTALDATHFTLWFLDAGIVFGIWLEAARINVRKTRAAR